MGTPAINTQWWNTEFVQIASPSVNVSALDSRLVDFLVRLGKVHNLLFGNALEITSGNDGTHVAGSAHGKNLAADIRSLDLTPDAAMLFGAVIGYLAAFYKIAVFDERYTREAHWHLQTADSVGG